ncbi:hypothetical protein ACFX13_013688 [Malus domestica]
MAQWTTARAVSGSADLRSRKVSPTLSSVKERTGRVASLAETERGSEVLREVFGARAERGLWEEEGRDKVPLIWGKD